LSSQETQLRDLQLAPAPPDAQRWARDAGPDALVLALTVPMYLADPDQLYDLYVLERASRMPLHRAQLAVFFLVDTLLDFVEHADVVQVDQVRFLPRDAAALGDLPAPSFSDRCHRVRALLEDFVNTWHCVPLDTLLAALANRCDSAAAAELLRTAVGAPGALLDARLATLGWSAQCPFFEDPDPFFWHERFHRVHADCGVSEALPTYFGTSCHDALPALELLLCRLLEADAALGDAAPRPPLWAAVCESVAPLFANWHPTPTTFVRETLLWHYEE
jgi:hypothetical protein